MRKLEQNEIEENTDNAIQPTELILSYATIEFQSFGLELLVEVMKSKYQRLVALVSLSIWRCINSNLFNHILGYR